MKPIKLVMSAFGPYKDKVEVNFSKLGESGIFLVTGDTGAGKTTIFDGISFALFGESSGSHRESTSFRSKFSDVETETYVELVFIHRDKEYKIIRNPAYLVPKKRGDGFTNKASDAYLEVDGSVITGLKTVNEKIIEILGINAKQFKQIAMLAQGEFLKILHADSDERKMIFRKIFNTEIFDLITVKLNEKYKNNKEMIESLKTEFVTNANNIVFKEQSIFVDKSNLTKETVLKTLDDLSKEISFNEEKIREVDEKLLVKSEEYKVLNESIKIVDENNKRIDILKKLREEESLLKSQDEEIKNIRIRVEKNNQILRIVKPIETNILRIEKDINDLNIKIKAKDEVIVRLLNDEKLISEKESNIKLLKPLVDEYNLLKKNIDDNNEIIKSILEVLEYYKEKKELTNNYLIEYDLFKKKDLEYKDNEDKYFRNQAGILATKLEDNKPCLVCGSLNHPYIAVVEDKVLTKEELDNLKKLVQEKLDKVNKIKEEMSSLNSKIELVNKKINCSDEESVKRLENEITIKNNEFNKKIQTSTFMFEEIYRSISNKRCSIDEFNLVEFIDEFNKETISIKQDLQSNRKLLEEFRCNLEKLDKDLVIEENSFNEVILSLGFKNKDDYLDNILSEEEITKLEFRISNYEKDLVMYKTKIEELDKLLIEKEVKDLTNEVENLSKLKEEVELITNEKQNIFSIYDNNLKISKRLIDTSSKLTLYMDKFSLYEELYKLASGTISGKRRVSFEQYVQATYFDMVLYEANLRFNNMTDGRFKLLRKESTDNLGAKFALDLDVYDEYNGSRRDVKSLSGGESFKASLSLALGLSDVIQNYSGGIVIDTLFIDEGFGSLDQESREQAINTLNLISNNNKLIGIISHVSELKDRIDKKIIVFKTKDGSEIKIEV